MNQLLTKSDLRLLKPEETISLDTPNQNDHKLVGTIIKSKIYGADIQFFVTDQSDHIMHEHFCGRFYEREELDLISKHFPHGGVFADVGANVGNHTIFVTKFLMPQQAVVFEPNPVAIDVLRVNIALNRISGLVDERYLGYALSDRCGRAVSSTWPRNLGATRMATTENLDGIPVVRGDSLIKGRAIDFMKIDTEGMEIEVLNGIHETISAQQPTIFIEVDNVNRSRFDDWLVRNNYHVSATFRRYTQNENVMAVPKRNGFSKWLKRAFK